MPEVPSWKARQIVDWIEHAVIRDDTWQIESFGSFLKSNSRYRWNCFDPNSEKAISLRLT